MPLRRAARADAGRRRATYWRRESRVSGRHRMRVRSKVDIDVISHDHCY